MAINATIDLATAFSVTEAYTILKPLTLFVIGVVIYAIFVFKFYQFLARKDIFEFDLGKYRKSKHPFFVTLFSAISYVIKYILLFPLFVFFWFIILSALLTFLSKNADIQNILLTAMALVAAVRITAYYTEDLSKDLAKMIPFALLAIFLIDVTFFSFSTSFEAVKQIPSLWKIMAYYLLFVIALEFVLRVVSTITLPFRKKGEE